MAAVHPSQDSATFDDSGRLYRLMAARADGTVDFFNQRILEYTGLDSRQLEGCGWEKKLSPRVLEDYIRERGPDHPLERLSRRELQVLKLIVEGNTNNQVGALLGLSPGVTSMEWLDAN
jgi:DNA-binding CsgD family transcriptional regulator